MKRTHLRIVKPSYNRKLRRQWRMVRFWAWVADVHLMVYPFLVVAFFFWLAYGHR